jgi:hypothetical protein
VSITDIHWWYGTMGESVFDRYSFVHAFMFVWVAIVLASFVRNRLVLLVLVAVCACAWETFESVVLTDLAIEPFTGTETVRNRYIGDTISDMSGYLTFLCAAWVARYAMMRTATSYREQGEAIEGNALLHGRRQPLALRRPRDPAGRHKR